MSVYKSCMRIYEDDHIIYIALTLLFNAFSMVLLIFLAFVNVVLLTVLMFILMILSTIERRKIVIVV